MIGDNRQAEYLEFDAQLAELNRRSAELAQERRALKRRMIEANIDPDAYALVRRMGRRDDENLRRWFHQLGQGLMWMERPIGYQPPLFEAGEAEPAAPAQDTDETQVDEPKRRRGRPKGSADSYKRPPRRKSNGADHSQQFSE